MLRLFLYSLLLSWACVSVSHAKPKITFFSQLPAHQLEDVFTDSALIQQLKALDASIVLGITDFHDHRTKTIHLLNAWEIPVTAWLMLPRKDNYWFTAKNHPIALKRYEAFKEWTQKDSLEWERVGFMVEPDIKELEKIQEADFTAWIDLLWQMADEKPYLEAEDAYKSLARQIEDDGFQLETYIYPYLLEEDQQHLNRLIGLIDINSEREIPLVFTNYIDGNLEKPVQSFIRKHGLSAIGVGSTGGENMTDYREVPPPLTFNELKQDLQTAHNFTNEVYIFSLEGCYRKGFLPKLVNLNMEQEELVASPINTYSKANSGENLVTEFLKRPYLLLLLVGLIAFLAAWVFLRILKRIFQ